MASKNIVLKGATWNGVESVDFPVSGGGTARYVETSDADATASDIASGKKAYVNGSLVTGTASGGGGGLEYESGTWTPNADVAQPTIDFVGTHADRPIYVLIADTTNTTAPDNSILMWLISSWYDAFSVPVLITSSIKHYARTQYEYASSGSYGSGGNYITSLTGSNNSSLPTYLTNEGFSPYTASTSRYWRSDRTYKWIAVWAPTTS